MRIAGDSVLLGEAERDGLLRAIETVLEVRTAAQFERWVRGPLCGLLAHDELVAVEVAADGGLGRAHGIRHGRDYCGSVEDSAVRVALARRLAAACHADPALPPTVRGEMLDGVGDDAEIAGTLVHATRFLSGSACYFVFFAVPPESAFSGRHLLRLLSVHLKTAWSRVRGMDRPGHPVPGAADLAPPSPLTAREQEILWAMAQGRSNQEISAGLRISPLTLKAHIRKIYRKLDVDGREAAIARASTVAD